MSDLDLIVTYFRMLRTFLSIAASQQYIFMIRIDFITSDMVLIRSSVTVRILFLSNR